MNHRMAMIPFAAALLLVASCATPYEKPYVAARKIAVPPPQLSMDLPLESRGESAPRFCQLGTSCRSMDPRPFAACLLATGRCPAESEPLLVTEGAAPR